MKKLYHNVYVFYRHKRDSKPGAKAAKAAKSLIFNATGYAPRCLFAQLRRDLQSP